MEIFQFEQFRTIAECGTMREAAEKLYLSQPTLSHNLKKLEAELGCQLFTRTRNRLKLTPYGRIVLERTQDLSMAFQAMLDDLDAERRRQEATLHVGCFSPITATFVMPQVAAELRDWSFDVVSCPTDDLVEGLESGRFDILVATDVCRRKSFKWRRLYSEQACVAAPPDAAIAKREAAKSADVTREPFVIEEGLAGYSDWFSHVLRHAGVDEGAIGRVPFKEHLMTKDLLPECHLITTFIMGYVQPAESRAIVPIDEPYAHRDVGLVFRSDAPAKIDVFVKYVRSNATGLFGGNAFVPFFLYPETVENLHVASE